VDEGRFSRIHGSSRGVEEADLEGRKICGGRRMDASFELLEKILYMNKLKEQTGYEVEMLSLKYNVDLQMSEEDKMEFLKEQRVNIQILIDKNNKELSLRVKKEKTFAQSMYNFIFKLPSSYDLEENHFRDLEDKNIYLEGLLKAFDGF